MISTITTFTTIIISVAVLLSFLNFYFFFYRNDKVFRFRNKVIDLDSKKNIKLICQGKNPEHLYDKLPSYNKMMFNIFKPIKLETYFTKKEIDELLEGQTKC